tara:strand:- start:11009 stop:11422 length:414 start_codon:yes stop_codon:yes gene_type:complete
MTYSYIRHEEDLEHMASRAIGGGVWFAQSYVRCGLVPSSGDQRAQHVTLGRFERGEVFDTRDDACLAALGQALADAADFYSLGYGSYAMRECTIEDLVLNPMLEELRVLIECWKSFSHVRQQVRTRQAALRITAEYY